MFHSLCTFCTIPAPSHRIVGFVWLAISIGGLGVLMLIAGCGSSETSPTLADLLRWLESEDPAVRYMAVESLGKYEGDLGEGIAVLCGALEDDDTNVRIGAAYALAHLGLRAEGATPALIRALKDKSPGVRMGAAYALPAMGPEAQAAIPDLKKAARDRNPGVRREAINSLKKFQLAAQHQRGTLPP